MTAQQDFTVDLKVYLDSAHLPPFQPYLPLSLSLSLSCLSLTVIKLGKDPETIDMHLLIKFATFLTHHGNNFVYFELWINVYTFELN